MLSHEETLVALEKAKNGDEKAKELLISQNYPLLKSVIRRFRGRTVEYDDLLSLASIGFMKAVNNFDPSFGVRFSTYAVPMILGEVKRFLRDDGKIKVSRALKLLSIQINEFVDSFKKQHGKSPTIEMISEHFQVEKEEIVLALDSSKMPVSLYDKVENDKSQSQMHIEKLHSKMSGETMALHLELKESIAKLSKREQKILLLRFYRDKTQGEVAKIFGVSQVQISRLESKIIEKLGKDLK